MIEVKNLRAVSFDLSRVDLYWEISDYSGNLDRYNFTVLRSESEQGPFELLAGPFTDKFTFRDSSVPSMHNWRVFYYKIRVEDTSNGVTKEFGPTSLQPNPDLTAIELIRLYYIKYSQGPGRRCFVFPVRTFGAKCFCYDPVIKQKTRSNCINCFDTGYLGGFLSPIEAFIQIDTPTNVEVETIYQVQQPINSAARLAAYPMIKPGDIVVEAENVRWVVSSSNSRQRLRAAVEQELVLHKVVRGDIKYKLPINVNETFLMPVDQRNYTNPQYVDTTTGLEDAISLFGRKI